MKGKQPTYPHQYTFRALEKYFARHHVAPTLLELSVLSKHSESTTSRHLLMLEAEGLIKRSGGRKRAMQLTGLKFEDVQRVQVRKTEDKKKKSSLNFPKMPRLTEAELAKRYDGIVKNAIARGTYYPIFMDDDKIEIHSSLGACRVG